MTKRLEKYLSDLKKETNAQDNDYIVPDLDNDQYSSSALSHRFKTALEDIGIYGATPHTCRHTFITNCFLADLHETDIMKWARIRDLKTLLVYKHLTRETDTKNINKLAY
jgi:integrase